MGAKKPTESGDRISARSIYVRTTLDERIFQVTGGTELIAITLLPRLLPLSYQTIKNKICKGTFELRIIRFNSKNYVKTADVAALIENSIETGASIRRRVGRPTNAERAKRKLSSQSQKEESRVDSFLSGNQIDGGLTENGADSSHKTVK